MSAAYHRWPVSVNLAQRTRGASPDRGPSRWIAGDFSVKALVDRVLALLLMVMAIPVMAVTGLLVKLADGGPILYCQTRTGRHGRLFTLVKFRTMRVESERHGACWSRPGDPRVTRVGRILRSSHLDELPQLWNVLRGDMSLIGPRPERPEFVAPLTKSIPHYGDRLQVRPGVTGLAQIQLPADTDLNSVRKKLVRDLYYIGNATLWLDLRILLATGFKMIGVPFGVITALSRTPQFDDDARAAADVTVQWEPREGFAWATAKPTSEAGC